MSAAPPPVTPEQNPWPGLFSYSEAQAHLFFGRETESEELMRLIQRETLTVLFGRSGLGKTSLLRAGVFPRLRAEGCFPIVLRLDYSTTADSPIDQVKALTEAAARDSEIDVEKAPDAEAPLTLWEYFRQTHFWGPRNDTLTPVLVFDQFEEIFTSGHTGQDRFVILQQLADLAENRVPEQVRQQVGLAAERKAVETGAPNYKIILSLREDFVWRLDSLRPILPAIMRNRFSLGPLDAARGFDIIRKSGGSWVTEDVARDIVGAVITSRRGEGGTGSFDELEPAYLNVMCNELFQRMLAAGQTSISRELVAQEKGGILEALYERSLSGLDLSVRHFVENRLVTASGFRVTLPIEDARRERVSARDLETLVDRRLLRFEDRLGARHVELGHDLLTGVVQKSREEREKAALHHQLHRARLRTALLAVVALLAIAGPIFYWLAWIHPSSAWYASFDRYNGTIRPFGHLSMNQVSHREESFLVTREGFLGRILSVQAVNGYAQPILQSSIESSIFYNPSGVTGHFCCIEFSYDEHGRVIHEAAIDKPHSMVFALIYAPSQVRMFRNAQRASLVGADGTKLLASFDIQYDSRGFLDQVTSPAAMSGLYNATVVKIESDARGRQIGMTYWNNYGQPVGGENGFEGKSYVLDSMNEVILTTYHDRDGHPIPSPDDEPPIIRTIRDSWGNQTELDNYDAQQKPMVFEKWGYQRITYLRDDHGLLREQSYFDATGNPVGITGSGCHKYLFEYDNLGLITAESCVDVNGKPMNRLNTGYDKITFGYDSHGRIIENHYFDNNGQPVQIGGCFGRMWGYDASGGDTSTICLDASGKASDFSALHDLAHIYHEQTFDFLAALELDRQVFALDPSSVNHINLEEADFTAGNFDDCLQQAASMPDSALTGNQPILRDALRMACQFADGKKSDARAAADSLLPALSQLHQTNWVFDGTRYYIQTSPRFQSSAADWDKFFDALEKGNAQTATDALRQLQRRF